MRTPQDDIKFLANSAYRVRVLSRLAESPADRDTLLAEIDISNPTLSRVLTGLQNRGWVRRAGAEYQITPAGKQLAADFAQLESNIERYQKLQLIEQLVPTTELGLDVELLGEATIITPTPSAPLRHVDWGLQLWGEAKAIRCLATGVIPEAVEVSRSAVKEKGQSFELIATPEAVDVLLSDASMIADVRETLSNPNAEMYLYEGTFPCAIIVADEVVFFTPTDEGQFSAHIESDNDELRDWAHGLIDGYAADSTQLTRSDFPDTPA